MIKLLFALIAIAGYIANIKGKKELSYWLWLASNTFWCVSNYLIGQYQLSFMFLVYTAFCLWGLNKEVKQ